MQERNIILCVPLCLGKKFSCFLQLALFIKYFQFMSLLFCPWFICYIIPLPFFIISNWIQRFLSLLSKRTKPNTLLFYIHILGNGNWFRCSYTSLSRFAVGPCCALYRKSNVGVGLFCQVGEEGPLILTAFWNFILFKANAVDIFF